jgi:hypothetical protein
MSFRTLIDTAQCLALADKLHPTEEAVWERYCREFSTRFSTPLMEVRSMDPLFVLTQVNGDNLSDFNPEENMESLMEMIGSLSDPEYDLKKERAIREENRQIEERERLRLERGEAIHPSMEKDKRVITKEQPPKELPKSGGLNMSAINRLNNQDREG